MIDPETNRSRGYGFVQYREAESARRAKEQLNGFELAGKPIKVGEVTEKMDHSISNMGSVLDDEETDRGGIEMNANARVQLMAKLASGNQMRPNKKTAPAAEPDADIGQKVREMLGGSKSSSSDPSPCFVLRNMFDPSTYVSFGTTSTSYIMCTLYIPRIVSN